MTAKRPTTKQIESALSVLLWLHENGNLDGGERDDVSRVRCLLDDYIDRRDAREWTRREAP